MDCEFDAQFENDDDDFQLGTIPLNHSNISIMDNSFDIGSSNLSVQHCFEKRAPLTDINKKIVDEVSQDSGYCSNSPLDKSSSQGIMSGPSPKQSKSLVTPQYFESFYSSICAPKKQTSTSFLLPSTLCNGLRCIDSNTMTNLLLQNISNQNPQYFIFDCRYPYEFEGGHISGALNIFQFSEVIDFLFECDENGAPRHPRYGSQTLLIFHCEFSANRAPTIARALRRLDRKLNEHNYPNLCYPELYMLKGGYKEYFYSQNSQCTPQNYRKMLDINFIEDMKAYRGICRSNSENTLLNRGEKKSSCFFGRSKSLKF